MQDTKPIDLQHIRNLTVSGRIATGASTLAKGIADALHWKLLDGGKLFRKINNELGISIVDSSRRPDSFDLAYEEKVKKILRDEKHNVIQSHLAGFDAQGIAGVYRILVLCEDEEGNDKTDIRIDRLINRDGISVEEAKHELKERERSHLEKFRRLYMPQDPHWVYWDKEYYDLTISTYSHNPEESVQIVLHHLGVTQ